MFELEAGFRFQNSFHELPTFLFEEVNPTPIDSPKLIHVSELKNQLGLAKLNDDELRLWLNGEEKIPGEQRISTRYAGHQFGVWAGQLGDGRAISLGEILTPNNERFEIQTKGSGLTPFSRMGDGKAVIRSSVREYLCSEAIHALGIPTTRVLALITGKDHVYRETIERSAIVARVFPSNIRFGHFEMCFHFEKMDVLKELVAYTQYTFFHGLSIEEMLQEIVKRTAKLMAQWQNVGFCHGVMNTDNMSVLGLTIDYGPFGFLDDTVLNFVCNHTDQNGRYAYDQQPTIAMWNLERFLICFVEIVPREKLVKILNSFVPEFEGEYIKLCRKKIGLKVELPHDYALFTELIKIMSTLSLDYTFTFRQLSHYKKGRPETMKKFWDYYGNREELKNWLLKYDERLSQENHTDDERNQEMLALNPKYVLKNYIAQEVIEEVEKDNDTKFKNWLNILNRPYDEHPEFEAYSMPTPPEHKHIEVSCSS